MAAVALSGCDGPPPPTSGATSAITQGWTDDNSIESNVVVEIGGQNCTGTLISPIAVLTAKHCVTGDDSGKPGIPLPVQISIGNGVGSFTATRVAVAATPYHDFEPLHLGGGITDGEQGIDVAILWLDVPLLEEAHILRPALASPPVGGADTNGGTYGHDFGYLGFAGWAPADGSTRQAILFNSVTLHHYPEAPDDIGQIWDYSPGPGSVNGGDSGGPLFLQHPDGTRDVLGVLSGHAYTSVTDCGTDNCVVWADVTRGEPARWIREQMIDTTPRGAHWLAMHPAYLWRGEVDYTGPCQLSRDQDCDHWFDEHDNCPSTQNVDQADANDDGFGDACTRPIVRFMSPSSGPPSGGTRVRFEGANFALQGTQIKFGGVPGTDVTCPSTAQCFATTPAGNGMVDVIVTSTAVSSLPNPSATFSYVPSVTGIEPANASVGDVVTIHGIGFSWAPGATTIRFGQAAVTDFSCYPGPDCSAIVPPNAGTVDVRVTVNGTTSAITPADRFYYGGARIDRIDVASGSIAGGTYVNLSGAGFNPALGGTQVSFGAATSDYVNCSSSTSCYVRSPSSLQYGTVHITFTAFGTSSLPSTGDQFTYLPNAVSTISWSSLAGGYLGLNGYAPAGGHSVALSSSDPAALAVPASLWIAPGASATTFSLTLLPIDHAETVTITASDSFASATTTVSVGAWPTVTLQLSADILAAGASATATVSLASAAPAGGAAVALSSSDPAAIAVPASVTVPAGSHTATVSFSNAYSGAPKFVTLNASYAGAASSASIQVPSAQTCQAHPCPRGSWFNPEECACQRGQPN